ncbi:MAG: hypothetical protein ABEJ43_08720 [Haloferacaceae archaeon]
MPTIVVPAEPPRPGLGLPDLAANAPVSGAEAARLYEACLRDALTAADAAGGDLIVTYPSADRVGTGEDGTGPEAAVRAAAAPALSDPADVRFEVQVGSTPSARLGNVVTHLLREEEASSVGYLRPTAYHTPRTVVDGAAMKSRSSGVVLGPAPDGRVHYAAFADASPDFTGSLAAPALDSLAARAAAADVATDFVETRPVLDRAADLPTLLATVSARRRVERAVPEHVAAVVDDLGLSLDGDPPQVVRE